MKVTVIGISHHQVFEVFKDGSGKSFKGSEVKVEMSDGTSLKFHYDYIVLKPKLLVIKVLDHYYGGHDLPEGISGITEQHPA